MSREQLTRTGENWSLAELVILSKVEPADRLAEIVGLPPDRSWNRGDPKKTRGLVEQFSGITYRSRLPRTADVSDHLEDVLSRLDPVKRRIAALSRRLARQEGRADAIRVWLTQLTSETSPGYDFSPAQLARIVEMGAWLGVSVDVYDPKDAETAAIAELAGIGGASERSAGQAG